MAKYDIKFEYHWGEGYGEETWHPDCLTNNGEGFDKEDALGIAEDLRHHIGNRNVRVVEHFEGREEA